MNMRSMARVFSTALAVAGLVASSTAAHADVKCRQTVAKESAKLMIDRTIAVQSMAPVASNINSLSQSCRMSVPLQLSRYSIPG